MDKTLLKQALKFKTNTPAYSQTPHFNKLAIQYQKENGLYFVEIKLKQRSKVLNWNAFFVFLSEVMSNEKGGLEIAQMNIV